MRVTTNLETLLLEWGRGHAPSADSPGSELEVTSTTRRTDRPTAEATSTGSVLSQWFSCDTGGIWFEYRLHPCLDASRPLRRHVTWWLPSYAQNAVCASPRARLLILIMISGTSVRSELIAVTQGAW